MRRSFEEPWWTTRGSNPPSQVCKTHVTPLRLLAHILPVLRSCRSDLNRIRILMRTHYRPRLSLFSGASRENRTHSFLLTRQAQSHCAREAFGGGSRIPTYAVQGARCTPPLWTPDIRAGTFEHSVIPAWCLIRGSNPGKTDFESAMSAICINQTYRSDETVAILLFGYLFSCTEISVPTSFCLSSVLALARRLELRYAV